MFLVQPLWAGGGSQQSRSPWGDLRAAWLPGAGGWGRCSLWMAEQGRQAALWMLAEVQWGALGMWGSAAGCR